MAQAPFGVEAFAIFGKLEDLEEFFETPVISIFNESSFKLHDMFSWLLAVNIDEAKVWVIQGLDEFDVLLSQAEIVSHFKFIYFNDYFIKFIRIEGKLFQFSIFKMKEEGNLKNSARKEIAASFNYFDLIVKNDSNKIANKLYRLFSSSNPTQKLKID